MEMVMNGHGHERTWSWTGMVMNGHGYERTWSWTNVVINANCQVWSGVKMVMLVHDHVRTWSWKSIIMESQSGSETGQNFLKVLSNGTEGGVKSGIIRSVLINCIVANMFEFILKEHHHERSIKRFQRLHNILYDTQHVNVVKFC